MRHQGRESLDPLPPGDQLFVQGLSLNGMLAKGHKVLGDMWSLLVRFCNYNLGLVGDVSKA